MFDRNVVEFYFVLCNVYTVYKFITIENKATYFRLRFYLSLEIFSKRKLEKGVSFKNRDISRDNIIKRLYCSIKFYSIYGSNQYSCSQIISFVKSVRLQKNPSFVKNIYFFIVQFDSKFLMFVNIRFSSNKSILLLFFSK